MSTTNSRMDTKMLIIAIVYTTLFTTGWCRISNQIGGADYQDEAADDSQQNEVFGSLRQQTDDRKESDLKALVSDPGCLINCTDIPSETEFASEPKIGKSRLSKFNRHPFNMGRMKFHTSARDEKIVLPSKLPSGALGFLGNVKPCIGQKCFNEMVGCQSRQCQRLRQSFESKPHVNLMGVNKKNARLNNQNEELKSLSPEDKHSLDLSMLFKRSTESQSNALGRNQRLKRSIRSLTRNFHEDFWPAFLEADGDSDELPNKKWGDRLKNTPFNKKNTLPLDKRQDEMMGELKYSQPIWSDEGEEQNEEPKRWGDWIRTSSLSNKKNSPFKMKKWVARLLSSRFTRNIRDYLANDYDDEESDPEGKRIADRYHNTKVHEVKRPVHPLTDTVGRQIAGK